MWDEFFLDYSKYQGMQDQNIGHGHDYALVLLSVIIAIFAAYTALVLTRRVAASAPGTARRTWLMAGASCMGGGVWAMHFTAMLAISLPYEIGYEPVLTAVSALFVIVAAAGTFHLVTTQRQNFVMMLIEGTLLGSGIGAMHYTGMAAMQLDARILYDPALFALSVGVAVALATLSVWILARDRDAARVISTRNIVSGAIVMGGSVAAMHYTGMAATHFIATPGLSGVAVGIAPSTLAFIVDGAAVLLLAMALLAAFFGSRLDDKTREAQETAELLAMVADSTKEGIIVIDRSGAIMLFSPGAEAMFGYDSSEVIGKSINILVSEAERAAHDGYIQNPDMALSRVIGRDRAVIGLRKDGSEVPLEIALSVSERRDGRVIVGICHDISERLAIEEKLRNSQRMEAVGQLTGGVAHDFNNLLAVILGNTELLVAEIGDSNLLATIDRAATRGAELTQRLLTFARQQALEPQSTDLTKLVRGLHDLLHRTLGEPVKFLTDVPEGLWPVIVDPGQLENALLNLAINARDAMPEGGILEIRCSNIELQEGDVRISDEVAAGNYVQIAVRDTGTGMTENTIEHAFEPFYTTKEVGEGSGLGLSMVYGFARQSGGNATIESEPGMGTEVRLLLPRSEVATASDELVREKICERGKGEGILVLEDDPDVRSFTVAALEGLGYRVLEAADANAALQVLEAEADNLDLLLSDVVLPGGISGPELAAKAKGLYPKLKLVFMSGYAADLYTHDKIPDFDETLLTKPFRLGELTNVIQDTLAA